MKKDTIKHQGVTIVLLVKYVVDQLYLSAQGATIVIIAQTVFAVCHLDIEPGDREADCGGIMDPVGVWVRKNGEWAIIHRCRRCGHLSSNRVAADDNPMKLMSIAMKPLSQPPFPLEKIEEMTALMGGDGQLSYG